MRLIGEARRHGLVIKVADILTSPRLCDMATTLSEASVASSVEGEHDVRPFELLRQIAPSEALRAAAAACHMPEDVIEDIFPCTPMQEGLMALTMADPAAYVWRCTKQLNPGVDAARLRSAFDAVVKAHPVLRTRIIDLPGEGFVQVVTSEMVPWDSDDSMGEQDRTDRQFAMGLGHPLVRVAVLQEDNRRCFVLTMHHAIYDGWLMEILSDAFAQAYYELSLASLPPFQAFIKAVSELDSQSASREAWKTHLAGNEAETFPRIPSSDYHSRPDTIRVRTLRTTFLLACVAVLTVGQ
jgi:hypothetical protein